MILMLQSRLEIQLRFQKVYPNTIDSIGQKSSKKASVKRNYIDEYTNIFKNIPGSGRYDLSYKWTDPADKLKKVP